MLYGLPGIGTMISIPSTLYPSSLFQYDVGASPPPKSAVAASRSKDGDQEVSLRPGGGGPKSGTTPKTSSKKSKKKKSRNRQQGGDKEDYTGGIAHDKVAASSAATPSGATPSDTGSRAEEQSSSSLEVPSLWPAWGRVSSSESEYSDTEGGQAAKMRSATSKIRQAALACLHATIKVYLTTDLQCFVYNIYVSQHIERDQLSPKIKIDFLLFPKGCSVLSSQFWCKIF